MLTKNADLLKELPQSFLLAKNHRFAFPEGTAVTGV